MLQSNFKSDLEKEQKLGVLLDSCYNAYLNHYHFERVTDRKRQMAGIDVIFTRRYNGEHFFIDEKAQLDYLNEDLPTFAFELSYQKKDKTKKGWLFDKTKKTDFYALVTGIYSDEPNRYTSCKITLVNRKNLIAFLKDRNLSEESLNTLIAKQEQPSGKVILDSLLPKTEGYLYFSNVKKAEKPVNLILKLDFLTRSGLAKRLV